MELPKIRMGTLRVKDADILFNANSQGFRHFDLAENYDNLEKVKVAFQFAFSHGLSRSDFWITVKVYFLKGSSHVTNLLEKTGLEYFDLLLYHGPFHHFKNEDVLLRSWQLMCSIDPFIVKHAGVSNFYRPHLERLLLICADHDLLPPFANEIQLSPFVFDEDLLFFCKEVDIKIIAYSPVGFDFSNILLGNSILTL